PPVAFLRRSYDFLHVTRNLCAITDSIARARVNRSRVARQKARHLSSLFRSEGCFLVCETLAAGCCLCDVSSYLARRNFAAGKFRKHRSPGIGCHRCRGGSQGEVRSLALPNATKAW